MVYIEDGVSAANATVGTNVASGKWYQIIDKKRVLRKLGMVSGNAATYAAGAILEIFFGAKKVAELHSRGSGSETGICIPPADTDCHWYMGNEVLPGGQPLNVIIKQAPTTNGIGFMLDMPEID